MAKVTKSAKQLALMQAEMKLAEAKLDAEIAWDKANIDKPLIGSVRFFNKSKGSGYVYIESLDLNIEIFASNIQGKKTWFPETACVSYEENEIIECHLSGSYNHLLLVGDTVGQLDVGHWELIKDSGLAFKCDSEGKALNGIFA